MKAFNLNRVEPIVRSIVLVIGLFAALFLGGCTATGSLFVSKQGTSTAYTTAQKPQSVRFGVILSVRDIELVDQTATAATTVGGGAGAVAGYGVGSLAGMSKTGRLLVAGVSALAGGFVGKSLASTYAGQEIVVQLEGGKGVIAIAQSSVDGVRFSLGQRVMVIGGGRVAPLML